MYLDTRSNKGNDLRDSSRSANTPTNLKKFPSVQKQVLQSSMGQNSGSKRFGCGLFNKTSRLSVKLEEDEDEVDDEASEAEKDFRESSELSSRSFQASKSPRFDHLYLSKVCLFQP